MLLNTHPCVRLCELRMSRRFICTINVLRCDAIVLWIWCYTANLNDMRARRARMVRKKGTQKACSNGWDNNWFDKHINTWDNKNVIIYVRPSNLQLHFVVQACGSFYVDTFWTRFRITANQIAQPDDNIICTISISVPPGSAGDVCMYIHCKFI